MIGATTGVQAQIVPVAKITEAPLGYIVSEAVMSFEGDWTGEVIVVEVFPVAVAEIGAF